MLEEIAWGHWAHRLTIQGTQDTRLQEGASFVRLIVDNFLSWVEPGQRKTACVHRRYIEMEGLNRSVMAIHATLRDPTQDVESQLCDF